MNTKAGTYGAPVRERALVPRVLLDYGIAVLSVITATIIVYLINTRLSDNAPYVSVFLCAVIFTTWFGGTRPGVLSILLSTVVLGYSFFVPFRSFALDFSQYLRLLFFMLPSFFVVWLTTRQRSISESLRQEITERKQAEESLQRIQVHLSLITDTIPALVWSALPDGSIDFINRRHQEFTGLSLEEAGGWRWTSIVHPDDRQRIVDQWRAALKTGEPLKTEFRLRRANGEYCWLFACAVPLRNELGTIVKWYGTKTDITELKRAEDALQKNEDQVRLIIDTIPMMVWTVQNDGRFDFFNKRWLDYAGLEVIENPNQIIHPEDVARVMEKWLATKAAGRLSENEMRLRRFDGEYRWFMTRSAPLHDEQGNVVKWYGVSIDIEDSKQLGVALRESEQRYLSLFQNMMEGVAYFQMLFRDGKLQDAIYLEVNPAWENLTGLHNVVGRRLTEVLPGALEAESEFMERAIRVSLTGQPERFETYSNSLHKWISTTAYCPKKEHVIVVMDDITERKLAEDKLRLAYLHLSYHVENTPLAVIEYDKDFFIKRWSKRAEEIFGWKASEVLGKKVTDFRIIYKDDMSAVDNVMDELTKGVVNWNISLNRNYTKAGNVIHIEWHNSVLRDEHANVITILSFAHDVTERRKAEEQLQQANTELHNLSSHLQNMQEIERTAIAREIHDELGQLLTGLKMEVGWLDKKLPNDPVLKEKGKEILSTVSELLKTVKKIASDLRPNVLDELGLITALEWQGQEFEKSGKVKFKFHTNLDDFNPERNLSTNIFRVHQEALTNIARHAHATQVETTLLKKEDRWLLLTIKDNGKGFNVDEEKSNSSFGLIGMKERALMLHGELVIKSIKGKGTIIKLNVPLSKPEKSES